MRSAALLAFVPLLVACASSGPALPPNVGTTVADHDEAPPPPKTARPVDPEAVARATGEKPVVEDGVAKISWPRDDVKVEVDGVALPPFLGLTSWVAFAGTAKPENEAMIMGDLVLLDDEVDPVMSALLQDGVEVTALHDHFFHDKPRVHFLHVGGEGKIAALGKAIAHAREVAAGVRASAKAPPESFDPEPPPMPSTLDAALLDPILRTKGQAKDGMYKAVFGRAADAACGCALGKAMGVVTWAAFAGSPADSLVDGDFAVTEDELQGVLKSLRGAGIHVVAIHHHMTGESPRILFVHYWGRGSAASLAEAVRGALDRTAAAKSDTTT